MKKHGGRILDRRVFYNGAVIFAEGSRGDTAYLIEDGAVRLVQNANAPDKKTVATVGRNGIFGEMALFDDNPRMASAIAEGTAVLIAIGRDEFDRKVIKLDREVRQFLNTLVQYCRETPIFDHRATADAARDTPRDTAIRAALGSRAAREALSQKDRFLLALSTILIGYTRRRLPPLAGDGGER